MDWYLIVLRAIHIAAAVFWAGAAFTTFGFLQPVLAKLGPQGQKFSEELMVRRQFPIRILAAAGVAIVAGLLLYWTDSGGLQLSWITSPSGIGFTIGAICGIVVFILGPTILLPSLGKLGAIGAKLASEQRPPTPEEGAEMARIQATLQMAGRATLVLLGIAVLCMATARYW
jgi:uncharacterized membrane protein